MKFLLGALALALLAGSAKADTITNWTYTGNVMNGTNYEERPWLDVSCGCSLSATMTLDTVGFVINPPTAWSFTDGTHTLNQTNSTIGIGNGDQLSVFTGGNAWTINVVGDGIQFVSVHYIDQSFWTDSEYVNGVLAGWTDNSGTWVDPAVATPEPGTLALVGLGLAALAMKRRKVQARHVWEPLA